jgi:hypothetical protein
MSKKIKGNEYIVYVKVWLSTTVTVQADSFEEALEKGKDLKTTDVIDFPGDHIDSSIEIEGVFKS